MSVPVFDGHNDTLLNLYMNHEASAEHFFQEVKGGHIDYSRAQKAGLRAGFFAVFPPPYASLSVPNPEDYLTKEGYDVPLPEKVDSEACKRVTDHMIDLLYRVEASSKQKVQVVTNFKSLRETFEHNQLAAVLHFEGAEAIDPDLSNLEDYYQKGLRSLGLVWSRPNAFAQGVPYRYPSTGDIGPGLTKAGKALVKKCNELGIMLDTSHLNEKGYWDVVSVSDDPIVATHSNAYALCPISRNLTDEQLNAIRASKGVVGVTYSVNMLRSDGKMNRDTPLQEIVRHIRYIADLIGVEHVALGSDFDGTTLPNELKDVTGVPKVVDVLREEGFTDEEVHKIASQNWLRVLKETWK
ncbi:membrane dipeptidase [Halobacillus andaensis]|uniref:Membrane dipeptidase n=1 Tax=Halobacillus andaensis TaxID=1176239 RepID=A0A917B2X4_HALAA|nr:dipeptidase [Halobacillus andaensis]MBP2004181.1 membrane dipeptidase [Halobacillus andaensis]GGF16411.1 membrane dipeptidase [Halobacillus andaensis]